jgi:hypothetical protein
LATIFISSTYSTVVGLDSTMPPPNVKGSEQEFRKNNRAITTPPHFLGFLDKLWCNDISALPEKLKINANKKKIN